MMEITYQLVLNTIQTIGVLIAVFYYIFTLRNQNQVRKSQFFHALHEKLTTPEEIKIVYGDILQWHWDDFDDFELKYGFDVNPEAFYQRLAALNWGNFLGNLWKKNLIDREIVYGSLPFALSQIWYKFKPIIEEQRVRYNFGPDYLSGLEFIAVETEKMWKKSVTGNLQPYAESIK